MGRPTTCTTEIADQVAEHIREYGFVNVAVGLVELNRDNHYEWMARGTEDMANGLVDTPFAVYSVTIKKAQADFQAKAVKRVHGGSQGWQSSAWMLERSDPDQFALRVKQEHNHTPETHAPLSPTELRRRREAEAGGADVAH